LNSFTNVGSAGGGTATLYAFTLEQFETFLVYGGDEDALANPSVTFTATVSDEKKTSVSFTGAFEIVSANVSSTIDEIRWGTTLADVIPLVTVPQPAVTPLALSVAGLGLAVWGRRRIGRSV
jgi:hypothetical protein